MDMAKTRKFDFKSDTRDISGAVAFLFVEDNHWLFETLEHLSQIGFQRIYAISPEPFAEFETFPKVRWIEAPFTRNDAAIRLINSAQDALLGRWVYTCYNGEFLHFPFDETRKIDDFTAFLEEERKVSAMNLKMDIYPARALDQLTELKVTQCWFDKIGYFSSRGRDANGHAHDQMLEVRGGFRWRMADFLPQDSMILNRSLLFRMNANAKLGPNFRFDSPEYEYAHAQWHNSPTTVTASLRAYKYLRELPEAENTIAQLKYSGSSPYQKRGQQFMELGFMEPGQWF